MNTGFLVPELLFFVGVEIVVFAKKKNKKMRVIFHLLQRKCSNFEFVFNQAIVCKDYVKSAFKCSYRSKDSDSNTEHFLCSC